MAIKTVLTYQLNGSTTEFGVPFEYLSRRFVKVWLIGNTRRELTLNVDYRFINKKTIKTTQAWGSAQGFKFIEIRRVTSATDRVVDFTDGSILRASDLNASQVQAMHIAEEARDLAADALYVDDQGNLDARGRKIVNVGEGRESTRDAVTMQFIGKTTNSIVQMRDQVKKDTATTASNKTKAETALRGAEAARDAAKASEGKAKTSETNAKSYETKAKDSMSKAQASETNARNSEVKARADAQVAEAARIASKQSETNAKTSETKAKESEGNAKIYSDNASSNKVNIDKAEGLINIADNKITALTNLIPVVQKQCESASASALAATKAAEQTNTNLVQCIGYEASTKSYNTDAMNAKEGAKMSETNALSYKNQANTSATNARNSEQKAEQAKANAIAKATEATAAKDSAEKSAEAAAKSAEVARQAIVTINGTVETTANNAKAAAQSAKEAAASALSVNADNLVTKAGLLETTGQSTTNTMHQKAITDLMMPKTGGLFTGTVRLSSEVSPYFGFTRNDLKTHFYQVINSKGEFGIYESPTEHPDGWKTTLNFPKKSGTIALTEDVMPKTGGTFTGQIKINSAGYLNALVLDNNKDRVILTSPKQLILQNKNTASIALPTKGGTAAIAEDYVPKTGGIFTGSIKVQEADSSRITLTNSEGSEIRLQVLKESEDTAGMLYLVKKGSTYKVKVPLKEGILALTSNVPKYRWVEGVVSGTTAYVNIPNMNNCIHIVVTSNTVIQTVAGVPNDSTWRKTYKDGPTAWECNYNGSRLSVRKNSGESFTSIKYLEQYF